MEVIIETKMEEQCKEVDQVTILVDFALIHLTKNNIDDQQNHL